MLDPEMTELVIGCLIIMALWVFVEFGQGK